MSICNTAAHHPNIFVNLTSACATVFLTKNHQWWCYSCQYTAVKRCVCDTKHLSVSKVTLGLPKLKHKNHLLDCVYIQDWNGS